MGVRKPKYQQKLNFFINHGIMFLRPGFEKMLEDIKSKKINTIIALKLDRITRSILDWGSLLKFVEDNDAYIDCVNDEVNNTTANGKMVTRIMMSVSQNEIERTSLKNNEKVDEVIKIINNKDIKNKLRLGVCMSSSSYTTILYNKAHINTIFDKKLKEIDEEYRTSYVNMSKYKIGIFVMAKIMEKDEEKQNQVMMYLVNNV